MMFECLKSDNKRLKALVIDLEQSNKKLYEQLYKLRAKLELRNKEILSLMKKDIIDLTMEEDTIPSIPIRKRSLDEFISWAFDENKIEVVDEEEKEEVVYLTPPNNKKIKF